MLKIKSVKFFMSPCALLQKMKQGYIFMPFCQGE